MRNEWIFELYGSPVLVRFRVGNRRKVAAGGRTGTITSHPRCRDRRISREPSSRMILRRIQVNQARRQFGSRHAPLFPDCSNDSESTPGSFARPSIFSYHSVILFSILFLECDPSEAVIRIALYFLLESRRSGSFPSLFFPCGLEPPNFQLSTLFPGSGSVRSTWFKTYIYTT